MEFNQGKCQVLHTRSKQPLEIQYSLHRQVLEAIDDAEYLGVTIPKDLNWNTHINSKVDINKIEMTQRRAVRWVKNNYFPYESASHMLNKLGWRSVENRQIDAHLIMFLTLKAPKKTASENVVCWIFLQTSQSYFLHTGKQCGPRSDCSFRSSLIWVHTVCRNDL